MKSVKWLPILFTVGQVIVFPYYIIWLKEMALTYTLFALLFALHSFAAALGYVVCKRWTVKNSGFLYVMSGFVYLSVFAIMNVYTVVLVQLALGFSQGYFRAWHITQKSYQANAVLHYIAVGIVMLMFAFIHIISPVVLIASFGFMLFIGGSIMMFRESIK